MDLCTEFKLLPIAYRSVERHNIDMRLERKDWILLVIAVLLAAVAIFQENAYLSNACIILTGLIVSCLVWLHADVHKGYRGILVTAITLCVFGSAYYISSVNFEKEMRRNYGQVYPSNISTPDSRCGPGDDVALFFGPNSFQVTDFPYTFLYIDGDPIISLGRGGDAITIDYLLLNDTNGDNIVNINKNIFWIKPDIERLMVPDRSKLAIADHSGHTALVLWFMNRTHLFVAGHFAYHGFTVDVHDTVDIALPNGQHLRKFSDNCFYNHQLFLTTAGLDAVSPAKGTTELKLTP